MVDSAYSACTLTYGSSSAAADTEEQRVFRSAPTLPTMRDRTKHSMATAGTSCDLSMYNAVAEFYVWNRDASNYVTLDYRCLSTDATQYQKIPAGQWVKITDIKPSGNVNITANTAACICEI